jgi:hypothetical protein
MGAIRLMLLRSLADAKNDRNAAIFCPWHFTGMSVSDQVQFRSADLVHNMRMLAV